MQNKAFDLTDRCVCGHLHGAHDAIGCVICDAKGHRCDGFWTQQEYDDAVQSALEKIAEADKERQAKNRGMVI